MAKEINNIAVPVLEELLKEAKGVWTNPSDTYYAFRQLEPDKRGSFGERVFAELYLKAFPRRVSINYQDGDQGPWDLEINGVKFEIKTASIGVNEKFQNEGLNPDNEYNGVLFLCVTPDKLYFKCVRKEDIPFDKLHDRKKAGTGSGHKWDLTISDPGVIELRSIQDFKKEFEKVFPEAVK